MDRAHISLASKDDQNYQLAQVTYMGKTIDVEVLNPYGFCSNPPLDALGVLFNIQSAENVGGIFNVPVQRFKNLKEWEVQIGNYQTQSSIKFPEDKSISIDSKDDLNVTSEKGVNVASNGGNVVIDSGSNKISIGGSSAELLALLDQLLTDLQGATVLDPVSGPIPFIPADIAKFAAIQASLATIKV